jgi:hypothetical protein
MNVPTDIRGLHEQLAAAEREAEALAAGLSEEEGARRPEGGGWNAGLHVITAHERRHLWQARTRDVTYGRPGGYAAS